MDNDPEIDASMAYYVERWFVPHETLVRRSGGSEAEIDALIAAKASPGIVYSRMPDGWWSALGAFVGKAATSPPEDGTHHYAPASLYWLRRALLALRTGQSASDAAADNRDVFCCQFEAALADEPLARFNYPDAFVGDMVNSAAARQIAESEWDAWTAGAYAVCLRSFTGQSCVLKESLARYLRTQFEHDAQRDDDSKILDAMERLAIWLMPFSPLERPTGTPGIAIDNVLDTLTLGCEEPYS